MTPHVKHPPFHTLGLKLSALLLRVCLAGAYLFWAASAPLAPPRLSAPSPPHHHHRPIPPIPSPQGNISANIDHLLLIIIAPEINKDKKDYLSIVSLPSLFLSMYLPISLFPFLSIYLPIFLSHLFLLISSLTGQPVCSMLSKGQIGHTRATVKDF